MKKRLIVLLAALMFALTFALAGCGEKGETGGGPDSGSGGTEQGDGPDEGPGGDSGEGSGEDSGEEPDDSGGEEVERKLRNLPADVVYDVSSKEYSIAAGDVELYGVLYRPVEVGKFPVVILCHGFNGHYRDFPRECERLAQRGYVAYAFDFAGAQAEGRSTGRTENDYSPLTMKEDLVAVIKHFKQAKFVDNSQIFLWGGSQGGFVAGLTAADDRVKDDVSALALYFPAFNIPDDWHGAPAQKTPLMGYYINADFIESVQDLDPFAVIPAYKGDVCIVWGDADALVARKYIDGAVAAYGADRAELTVIEGAGHGFGGAALNTAIDTVLAFLEARTYEAP